MKRTKKTAARTAKAAAEKSPVETGPGLKKTTLLIPEALWLKARHQALDERTNIRKMLLEGLEMRLAMGPAGSIKPGSAEDWIAFYERKNEERKKGGAR